MDIETNEATPVAGAGAAAASTTSQIQLRNGSLGYDVMVPESSADGTDRLDLVFVHGWPLNRSTWRPAASNFGDRRRHLLDFPGCGDSITPDDAPLSFAAHVDALVEAVDALGLERFVLIGHDSGGGIARYATAAMGDKVAALVVAGTEIPGYHPKLISRLQKAFALPGAERVTRAALASRRIGRSRRLLGALFHDRSHLGGDFHEQITRPIVSDPAVMERQKRLLMALDHDFVDGLAAVHRKITCPTLLVWGRQDRVFPVDRARAMTGQFGGPTSFEEIDQAGLLVHQEQPGQFADAVKRFMAERAV